MEEDTNYIIHPITMDAMLQTAIIAGTGGSIQRLRAPIPSTIQHVVIRAASSLTPPKAHYVHARAESVGYSTTVISAEFYSQQGHVCAQLKNVRLVAHEGCSKTDYSVDRHPISRVLWKPDVYGLGLASPCGFFACLNQYQPG